MKLNQKETTSMLFDYKRFENDLKRDDLIGYRARKTLKMFENPDLIIDRPYLHLNTTTRKNWKFAMDYLNHFIFLKNYYKHV